MENKDKDNSEKQDANSWKQIFTGRLSWWQILVSILFVGYLAYGKYQEVVVKGGGSPQSVPARTK
jgi:hypothetical protein